MKNHKIILRAITIFLTIGLTFVVASFYLYPRYQKYQEETRKKQELDQLIRATTESWEIESQFFDNQVILDINGDGYKEKVVNHMMSDDVNGNSQNIFLSVYNYKSEEIGRTAGWVNSPPATIQMRAYKLDASDKKEYLSTEFSAGPHQSETMFFELYNATLLPVCFVIQSDNPYDCLFYAGNVGGLVVSDLDGNNKMEVIETVDEYPADGQLSSEEESAIRKAFEEQSVTEFTEGAKRIAIREKGGRGKTVIWAIYSYNGTYFVPQTGKDYETYYSLIEDSILNKMRVSELSENSLDYIQFARGFWTHRK